MLIPPIRHSANRYSSDSKVSFLNSARGDVTIAASSVAFILLIILGVLYSRTFLPWHRKQKVEKERANQFQQQWAGKRRTAFRKLDPIPEAKAKDNGLDRAMLDIRCDVNAHMTYIAPQDLKVAPLVEIQITPPTSAHVASMPSKLQDPAIPLMFGFKPQGPLHNPHTLGEATREHPSLKTLVGEGNAQFPAVGDSVHNHGSLRKRLRKISQCSELRKDRYQRVCQM